MASRLNHLAVFVSALAFFIWGWVWYSLLFGGMYTALVGKASGSMSSMGPQFAISFIMGWLLSYVTAIALHDTENPNPVRHGIEFGVFFGVGIYATMTLVNYAYDGRPYALWAINAGYVVTGMAIIGGIIGAWLKKPAAAST